MDGDKILKLKQHFRLKESSDKGLLINDHTGEFYHCNETALFILRQIQVGSSLHGVIQAIDRVYNISKSDSKAKVDYIVLCLKNLKAVIYEK